MPTTILAIESSCDETAVAILRHDGGQMPIFSGIGDFVANRHPPRVRRRGAGAGEQEPLAAPEATH